MVDSFPNALQSSDLADRGLDQAVELAMQLMAIPGASGNEADVADFVRRRLRMAGAPTTAILEDSAPKQSPMAGKTGNLVLKLPGTYRAPRRLLMAHLDTVPICVGSQPVRKAGRIVSANPQSGLGADDRAGVAVTLHTAMQILRYRVPHPPLTFLWTVQEEIGLQGARHLRLSSLGTPKLAFNWDGGAPQKLTIGATGGYRLKIDVRGVASHAGNAPEHGVSAIAIASLAIAELHRKGWHGRVTKRGKTGTTNIGIIQGGSATNVVNDHVLLQAEARSHDPKFRRELVRRIESGFRSAAKAVRNEKGTCGKVSFSGQLDYESFRLDEQEPAVLAAARALRQLNLQPLLAVTNGGLDANWMTARGIPTVSLGCGQIKQHTVKEALDLHGFRQACQVAWLLATPRGTESGS